MGHSSQQIKSGFIWSALDSFGNQAIGLVISLTLANLLGPSAYGLVAMLTIFIAIAAVFVNSGFNSALIRKVDRNEKDYSTTFYFSFAVSIICYLLLFFCAPLIADFYEQPELTLLTRVIALVIIIQTLAVIPRTKLTVEINFKSQAKANVVALVCSGTVGLIMAFNGYGVWSLVFQQLTNAIISVAMLNLLSPWKPVEKFCKQAFKELFGFGSKLLAAGLLDTIYNNLYGLIIGKQFSAAQLGIFNQANSLSTMPATMITGVIQKVTYPMLSNMQGDTNQLDKAYLLTLKIATMLIFPIMFGICIIAKPLIAILLGEQWQDSAQLISILTMALALYPIHAINLNMLQVKGRSDLFLKLEIIKKAIITISLVITVPMGIVEMCIGMVVTSYLALIVNTYYAGQLSSVSQLNQLAALLPIAIITLISATVGYVVGSEFSSNIASIILMLTVALTCYATLMFILQKSLVLETKKLLRGA
ncbi:lipopolysaccharide biosynthesis protein [Shewanella sp. 10N.286.48.B5]|uniref:lipopolysaccharide biosynthesis protein n=1 Tax=Shewanella sp. 10N.286.48.B5 TaxID=1880834 RepID=UPI000C848DC8|nr:lipopolysaccharide biosynthesis protein [Shewanella sp. 10N.286.48.B5]PMH84223.1 lipopolysaccharide biosynthesis protein [Shewanella sp. 10N.286.48.B5]